MPRTYNSWECPSCRRRIGDNGANRRAHLRTCPPRLDARLDRILIYMAEHGASLGPRLRYKCDTDDFAKGRFSYTLADARKLEAFGAVTVERELWKPRQWMSLLTPDGLARARRAMHERPNSKGGSA